MMSVVKMINVLRDSLAIMVNVLINVLEWDVTLDIFVKRETVYLKVFAMMFAVLDKFVEMETVLILVFLQLVLLVLIAEMGNVWIPAMFLVVELALYAKMENV